MRRRRFKNVLPPIFVLDEVEADLFRSHADLIQKAGCWGRFLNFLLSQLHPTGEGSMCGLKWRISSEPVILRNGEYAWGDRVRRWVEVTNGRDTFVASVAPFLYSHANGHQYVEHRFVVSCTNPAIAPLILLFGDHILS